MVYGLLSAGFESAFKSAPMDAHKNLGIRSAVAVLLLTPLAHNCEILTCHAAAARASPDVLVEIGTVLAKWLNKTIPFDVIGDFTPIAKVATTPLVLFAHPSVCFPGILDGAGARPQELACRRSLLRTREGCLVHASLNGHVPEVSLEDLATGRHEKCSWCRRPFQIGTVGG